jgi:hypothetical protein
MPTKKRKVVARATRAQKNDALLTGVARAVDMELEWFFSYAEGALGHDNVSMLPNHLASIVPDDEAEEKTALRALVLATAVRDTVNRLPHTHSSVLRAAYTPRTWPNVVKGVFKSLTPIAVRLYCASRPWPARTAHQGLETAAARELATALNQKLKPQALQRDSERVFGKALQAYAQTRGVA